MTADLEVTTGRDGHDRPVVAFAGEVDVTNIGRFRDALEAARPGQTAVVADLNDLGYLDSAGVEVLFAAARRGALEIVAGPECRIRRVLEVVGLDQVATIRAEPPPGG